MWDISMFNFTAYDTLEEFVQVLVGTYLVSAIGLIAVIFLIKAGFDYVISGGDPKKTEQSQKAILYILIGLVICLIAPIVVNFLIQNVLT